MPDELDFDDLTGDELELEPVGGSVSDNGPTTAVPIITITLDTEIGGWIEYGADGEPIGRGRTIADAIIQQTVHKLVSTLKAEAQRVIRDAVRDAIQEQVGDLIADVISNPVQLTNQFGERTGREITVREHIAKEVESQLTQRRDDWTGRGKSVLTTIIEKEVDQALSKELKGAVTEARNKVVNAVRDKAASILATSIKEGLRS